MSKVAIVKCKNYERKTLDEALDRGISLIGEIDSLIKENSKVLIKPNLLSARRPQEAATTHPEFIRAIIRLLKKRNCKISLGDSPSGYGSNLVDRIYEVTGIRTVCEEEGVRLIKFDEARIIGDIPIARAVFEQDLVISAPKFKTHNLLVLTGAIKNMYGAVTGLTKVEFHKKFPDPKEFSKLIAKVFSLIKPGLSIVDGILAMDGEGPSGGRIRNLGLIVIGQDAVSVDTILARIANIDVKEISTITEVNRLGIGESNLEAIETRGENLKAITVKDFKLPSSSILARLPKPIVKNVARLITFKPYINKKQCTRCNICVRSCPVNTIKEKNNYLQINYSGCINCMCCFEVCAFGAVEIKRSFLVKIFSIMEYRRDYES